MRRIPAEWLLVVLLLMPVVGCLAYAAWARGSYRAELGRMVEGARELVQRSVQGSQGGFWSRQSFPGATRVFRRERVYSYSVGRSDWTVGTSYPQGARADDLADAGRRALLENGTPAADVAGPHLVDGLRQFASIYRAPSLTALRGAQMPADTMLFLLDRLPEKTVFPEGRSAARDALRRIAALQAHGDPRSVGLQRTEAGLVFRDIAERPFTFELLPDGAHLAFRRRAMNELVTVVYGDRPAPGAIWSAELDAPVRGTWSLEARHGPLWWNVPHYRSWIAPLLLAATVYVVVLGALAFAMRRRRQLDEARARLLAEIAHDLRTPLTVVRLHAELLASPTRRADREEKYLGVLEREAVRASDLLANLLDLSRLDRGQRVYDPKTRRIGDLVEPCVTEFRQLYPARAADLDCEGDPGLKVCVDSSALQRCITNLLDNAGKYTPEGTPIHLAWSALHRRVFRS